MSFEQSVKKNCIINNELHTLNSVSVCLVASPDHRMSQWVLHAKLSSAWRNLFLLQFLTAFSYLSEESDISGIKHSALLTTVQMQILGCSHHRIRRNCAPVQTAVSCAVCCAVSCFACRACLTDKNVVMAAVIAPISTTVSLVWEYRELLWTLWNNVCSLDFAKMLVAHRVQGMNFSVSIRSI